MNDQHGHVVMLLASSWVGDSRVLKEADSLAAAGWRVSVVAIHSPAESEDRNGVSYIGVESVRILTYLRSLIRHPFALRADRRGSAELPEGEPSSAPTVAHGTSSARVTRWVDAWDRFKGGPWRGRLRWLERPLLWVIGGTARYRLLRRYLLAAERTVVSLRPDVIHAHDFSTLPAAAVLAQRTGAAMVYDSHELALEVSNRPKGVSRWLLKRRERHAIGFADEVITVSDSIAGELVRRYGVPTPTVLFNAPPLVGLSSSPGSLRADIGARDSEVLVLYLGAPAANRGVDILVEAMPFFEIGRFVMIGPRRPDWEEALTIRATELGVAGRLRFLDPLPLGELIPYIAEADVSVIPYQNVCLNHEYCMPNKLFEAVLAGVPVVVADLAELRAFVERYEVGVSADETDPESIAAALRLVADEPAFRSKGSKLLDLADRFSWEAQGTKLVGLYRSFAS